MRDGSGVTWPTAQSIAVMLAEARLEIFPSTSAGQRLSPIPAGATVTVTCSPRRGIEPTLELSERLSSLGFRAVPHLAARQINGAQHLSDIVGRLDRCDIDDVFVVGGDATEPVGEYSSALEILSALAELGHRFSRVGIAGYPERHPRISDAAIDDALLAKQGLASYIVTQICFDPGVVLAWLRRVRRLGMGLPVYVSMPGPLARRRLLAVALRVGVGDSMRFIVRHGGIVRGLAGRDRFDPDAFVAGIANELHPADDGVAGFHINTFNQLEATDRWRRRAVAAVGGGWDPVIDATRAVGVPR